MRRLLRLLRRLGHDKFSIGVDRLFPDGGGISGREKGCRSDRARGRFLQRVRIAPPSSGDLLPPSPPSCKLSTSTATDTAAAMTRTQNGRAQAEWAVHGSQY